MNGKYTNLKALGLLLAIAGASPARAIVSPRVNVQQGLEAQGPCLNCGRQGQVDETPETLLNQVYIFGNGWDYRHQMRPTEAGPLRAVGQMLMNARDGTGATGSAFLITPCHILTSAHVARDPRGSRTENWDAAYFAAGDERQLIQASRIRNGGGDYVRQPNSCNEDWEVLRLSRCVGDSLGFLPLDGVTTPATLRQNNVDLISAGYPHDKEQSRGLTLDPQCEVENEARRSDGSVMSTHRCSALAGDSGGPLLTREAFPRVIGMHCKVVRPRGQSPLSDMQRSPDIANAIFNGFVPSSAIYTRVRDIVMRSDEQDYIRKNSRLPGEPRAWSPTGSHPGPWQAADPSNPNRVPRAPRLQWNNQTVPPNWTS